MAINRRDRLAAAVWWSAKDDGRMPSIAGTSDRWIAPADPEDCKSDDRIDMPEKTHQTVRLSRGRHKSPQSGACVMELASMLGGEPFSDRPACVCPLIAGFLRVYNDRLDNDTRQDLYAYAAKVVGSRGSASTEAARAARLVDWVQETRSAGWTRGFAARRIRAIRQSGEPRAALIGSLAADGIRRYTPQSHTAVLALIDELLEIGQPDQPAPVAVSLEAESEASRSAQPACSGAAWSAVDA